MEIHEGVLVIDPYGGIDPFEGIFPDGGKIAFA